MKILAYFLTFMKQQRGFILFLILMFIFRSAFADWNEVPTGSMKPTIVEGDRILVNKLAYDLRLPFTHISLLKLSDPKRGDIVVFDSSAADKRLVKRVIGLPGDRIAMRNNVVVLNGQALEYDVENVTDAFTVKSEGLPGADHKVQTAAQASMLSSFGTVEVPQDVYLVLGDNRDNSSDSRVIGFVPREEIVGRTQRVVVSLDYDNYYMPRSDRFWHTL